MDSVIGGEHRFDARDAAAAHHPGDVEQHGCLCGAWLVLNRRGDLTWGCGLQAVGDSEIRVRVWSEEVRAFRWEVSSTTPLREVRLEVEGEAVNIGVGAVTEQELWVR